MIGLTDLYLAARSRRRHRLPDENQPPQGPACRLSVEDVTAHLKHSVGGIFDSYDQPRVAAHFKFLSILVASGRLTGDTEGTP